ncbi:hypothetical protein [Mycolicibacterium septicum]|uniref:bestrophin-like domain n=1 Tax=Mycolicibacterium septicum TaxID=98668 RepID=UPI00235F7716|nr:hypothetical protein [Mycolicibacterium septicum]
MNITHYPPVLFVASAIVLGLSAWAGTSLLGRRRQLEDDLRPDLSVILGATLTLLGLVIGFSFSMAVGRYDQRKDYEEAEANAIGTAFVRADLLPAGDAARVRILLAEYLDERISAYTTNDERRLSEISSKTAQLQTDMWSAVKGPASANPTPVIALVVSGMNDVLNSQGYTVAANRNRIPTAAWVLMVVIAICCNILVGWGFHRGKGAGRLLVILPLVSAVAFMLIADIDTPRHGIIRVQPQNLISLAESIHPN